MFLSDKHEIDKSYGEQGEARILSRQAGADPAAEAERQLQQLMQRCQLGERVAFEQLYRLTSAKLTGIACRFSGSFDTANDIIQESFIQVWQNCHQYQSDKGKVISWLIAIVRYRALDRLRAEQRTRSMLTIDTDKIEQLASTTQDSDLDSADVSHASLQHCLKTLSHHQRTSILMAYFYGHNRDQIAQHFNTPVSTVKSWLRRGLGRLQSCLSQ